MSDFNVPGSRPKKNDEISEIDREGGTSVGTIVSSSTIITMVITTITITITITIITLIIVIIIIMIIIISRSSSGYLAWGRNVRRASAAGTLSSPLVSIVAHSSCGLCVTPLAF